MACHCVDQHNTNPGRSFSQQNTGQTGGPPGLDSRVEQAWLQGYTGEGVVVTVVDDGTLG